MADYKIGDWLIDKRTKQTVRITKVSNRRGNFYSYDVYKFNNNLELSRGEIIKYYDKLDINCPVARVLYTNSSNKAVTNETNEE